MPPTDLSPVLIAGRWREANAVSVFRADNPQTGEATGPPYPVSSKQDLEEALEAGAEAAKDLLRISPGKIARFLDAFADGIEAQSANLVDAAHEETGLPESPRLADVEMPRTVGQLRQAAAAAADRSWTLPTIERAENVRCMYGALGGPVAVFGPNNFPFAFNSAAGGDFASAIAAGNPVIAKANPGHPRTTETFARIAFQAVQDVGLPPSTVQLVYQMPFQDGEWFVAHPRIAATAFTGSKHAALVLKAAADAAGKLFYMETGSVNPILLLPGALDERMDEIVDELTSACLVGTGQFCTQPGIVFVLQGKRTETFIRKVADRFEQAPPGTLLGAQVQDGLANAVEALVRSGAKCVTGGCAATGQGFRFANTVLRVDGARFAYDPANFQREAFGNETLIVVIQDAEQLARVLDALEGNLTGSIYSSRRGKDDPLYDRVEPLLRRKVGRLLNDRMPTGVAVCSAMNHGGPYPATAHPGFTAVGIPASLLRFAALHCYDNVREHRLPVELRDKNPTGKLWRQVDGEWTREDVKQMAAHPNP